MKAIPFVIVFLSNISVGYAQEKDSAKAEK
jgi:hypothetical protein